MAISRRTMLRGSLAAAGVAAAGAGVLVVREGPGLASALRERARRAASPRLPPAPPGPLEPETLQALLAAAGAWVGRAAERPQYAELYRSRAASLSGYLRLYRRFADRLGPRFAGLSRDERLAAVADLAPPGRLARLRLGLAGDERLLFRRYVAVETLALYAATDAWTALGYAAWPGTPRGLSSYTRPPGSP